MLELYPHAICKLLPQQGAYYVFKDELPETRSSAGTLGKGITPARAWENSFKNLKRS